MADQKVTALTENTAPLGGDYLYQVDDPTGTPTSKRMTGTNFMKGVMSADGFMLNGKLSVTVVANDLVVAIKTLAGSDPSALDPVIVRINGTFRTITAATSNTLADGTNWFGLGPNFTALEQDLFAYAVWDSNSSIVDVTYARISHGRLVSDFSSTTTNEKYLANYARYTSTDDVAVIGRFAATLGVTATYLWTVPTYTNLNMINHPIYETRVLNWSPTYTNLTTTSATLVHKYQVIAGGAVKFLIDVTWGASTSIAGSVTHTIPFARGSQYSNLAPVYAARFYDSSAATSYAALAYLQATSGLLVAQNAAGTYLTVSAVSSTVPFTWATSDAISYEGYYWI